MTGVEADLSGLIDKCRDTNAGISRQETRKGATLGTTDKRTANEDFFTLGGTVEERDYVEPVREEKRQTEDDAVLREMFSPENLPLIPSSSPGASSGVGGSDYASIEQRLKDYFREKEDYGSRPFASSVTMSSPETPDTLNRVEPGGNTAKLSAAKSDRIEFTSAHLAVIDEESKSEHY